MFTGLSIISSAEANEPSETGLLFYLSGDKGLTADYSNGEPEPGFIRGIDIIPDGASGSGFQCAHNQLLAYWAP